MSLRVFVEWVCEKHAGGRNEWISPFPNPHGFGSESRPGNSNLTVFAVPHRSDTVLPAFHPLAIHYPNPAVTSLLEIWAILKHNWIGHTLRDTVALEAFRRIIIDRQVGIKNTLYRVRVRVILRNCRQTGDKLDSLVKMRSTSLATLALIAIIQCQCLLVRSQGPPPRCQPYTAQNECRDIVQTTIDRGAPLEYLFNITIADPISNIRMIIQPRECRTAMISLFCGVAFPTCVSGDGTSNGTAVAVIPVCNEYCEALEFGPCGFIFQAANLTCASFGLPPDNCLAPPIPDFIPVETCRPDGVECCAGVLRKERSSGECNFNCPIVYYSEDKVSLPVRSSFVVSWLCQWGWVLNLLVIFYWVTGSQIYFSFSYVTQDYVIYVLGCIFAFLSLTGAIIGIVPFASDPLARQFPSHLPIFVVLSSIGYSMTTIWSLFGGGKDYVCGDADPGQSEYGAFLSSSTAIAQAFFWSFFFIAYTIYGMWMTIRLFCISFQKSRLAILLHIPNDIPQNNVGKVLVHGTAFIIPLALTIPLAVLASQVSLEDNATVAGDDVVLRYIPIYTAEPRSSPDSVGYWLIFFPTTLILGVTCILSFLVMIRLWQVELWKTQWRAMVLSLIFLLTTVLFFTFIYRAMDYEEQLVNAYQADVQCHAMNPREIDPPCGNPYLGDYALAIFALLPLLLSGFLCCAVAFLSNKNVYRFWGGLFVKQEVKLPVSQTHRGTRSSTRQKSASSGSSNSGGGSSSPLHP